MPVQPRDGDGCLAGQLAGRHAAPGRRGPFSDGRYTAPQRDEAAGLASQASETFARGATANQRSDNYVLTGVLFALALFFAGIASQLRQENHTRRLVHAAALIMLLGICLLAIQPKSFGV